MKNSRTLIGTFGLAVTLLIGGVACSSQDQANAALEKAGVDANVSTDGDLPSGFPEEVGTPDLPLENGAAVAGTYTLRYTSDDPAADAAAYKEVLQGNEFTMGEDFSFDKASGDYQGFMASNEKYSVIA
ncbi:hypothetical protein BH10ACT3_BH10ACT3_09000 [soil metagenome]